jgi:hypothetical protein
VFPSQVRNTRSVREQHPTVALFAIEDDAVELYADKTRALPVADPEDRELTISCGAALLNLRIALHTFGYHDIVESFPHPEVDDLLARVRIHLGCQPTAEDTLLFDAIPRRRTNRLPFEHREVPPALLAALEGEADDEGAWLHIVQGESTRQAVADLISGAETMLWSDMRYRREVAAWLHPHRRHRREGIPGYAPGLADLKTLLGSAFVPAPSGRVAPSETVRIVEAPVLAVLGTDSDTPFDWLAAGQALERVLLRARADGVWASFLNQPIEVQEVRLYLRAILGRSGLPQVVLRLGYAPGVPATPRRPVNEVLL